MSEPTTFLKLTQSQAVWLRCNLADQLHDLRIDFDEDDPEIAVPSSILDLLKGLET